MEVVKDNKELLLITMKVSNHTKVHTQKQQLAVRVLKLTAAVGMHCFTENSKSSNERKEPS